MKHHFKFLLIALFLAMGFGVQAQQKKKNNIDVKAMLDSVAFIYVPTSVTPQRGRTRMLDGYFDLKLKHDSLFSYLPYFGRVDIAPITIDDTGMRFTSTDFTYSATPGKKGKWDVKIKVKDQTNGYLFTFTIYDDGTGYLNVTSNFRDPISYRGYIKAIKKE